jgi:hypothetical protein
MRTGTVSIPSCKTREEVIPLDTPLLVQLPHQATCPETIRRRSLAQIDTEARICQTEEVHHLLGLLVLIDNLLGREKTLSQDQALEQCSDCPKQRQCTHERTPMENAMLILHPHLTHKLFKVSEIHILLPITCHAKLNNKQ